jgi:hypothetical protein
MVVRFLTCMLMLKIKICVIEAMKDVNKNNQAYKNMGEAEVML